MTRSLPLAAHRPAKLLLCSARSRPRAVPASADKLQADASLQPDFAHTLEVHDVGTYRFKGVSFDFSIKSVNVSALSGRNATYTGDLKASKAKKTSEGHGLEQVRMYAL